MDFSLCVEGEPDGASKAAAQVQGRPVSALSQSAVTLLDCSAVPCVRAVGSGGVLTSTQILSTCRWRYHLYRVIFTIALPDRCHHPILGMWGSRPSAESPSPWALLYQFLIICVGLEDVGGAECVACGREKCRGGPHTPSGPPLVYLHPSLHYLDCRGKG